MVTTFRVLLSRQNSYDVEDMYSELIEEIKKSLSCFGLDNFHELLLKVAESEELVAEFNERMLTILLK